MKENLEKRVVGLFFLMLLIIAGVAWAAVKNIERSRDKTDWVNHVHAVILDSYRISSSLHSGDASMSQYLLSGDGRDQANYRTSYNAMSEWIEDAIALTRADPSETGQQNQILTLKKLIQKHIDFTRNLVTNFQGGGIAAARQAALAHPDGESTGDIDRLTASLNGLENSLLVARDKEAVIQAANTKYVVYSGVIVNFGLLLFASVLIRDDLNARRVAATALADANAQLEAKVQERTAELVKSNQALKKENLERRWSYQALDHQLRYNQLIVNSINEMVFVVSKALNISRVNPAVTHVTQWEPQDLISQAMDRVLQLPAEGTGNPIITALNDGRELQERPAAVLTKSGGSIPVRFNLVPLRDDNKVVGGVITVRPYLGAPPKTG
jgi:PAS domain S-box-containing protein